jgi:hypothetical protein
VVVVAVERRNCVIAEIKEITLDKQQRSDVFDAANIGAVQRRHEIKHHCAIESSFCRIYTQLGTV